MLNWKLRLKNKATLVAIVAAVIAFIYQILGLLNIVPSISSSDVTNVVGVLINILVALGIVVDPTTDGISDSSAALGYTSLKVDEVDTESESGDKSER